MTADGGDRPTQHDVRGGLVEHHRAAHAWARHCCRDDRSEAEDVLQATYLKVLDGRARFDGRASFKTWLFAVIHRTAADHRRRRALRRLLTLRWGDEPGALDIVVPAVDESVDAARQRARLAEALALLPRRQREVLLLVFYHERSVDEAAGVLSIGVGSARQHYARGKERLRALLADSETAR